MQEVKGRKSNQNQGDEFNYQQDIQKLKNMWREVHQDGGAPNEQQQAGGEQQQSAQQIYKERNQAQASQHLVSRIQELEMSLQNSIRDNEMLMKRLQQKDSELTLVKEQLNKVHDQADWKIHQMQDLNHRYHEIAQTHNDFLGNARSHADVVSRDLQNKDKEIKRLNDLLAETQDKLKVVSVTQEKNLNKCIDLDRRSRQLEDENVELKKKLEDRDMKVDMLNLNKKAEGTFLVEVEHLRSDVKRLVQMLKNTAEFKEFAEFAEDSGHSIRFLKDIKRKSYVDAGCSCKCSNIVRPCQEENQLIDEKMLWIPEEAFKFAHEFRIKYQGDLTDTLIERLLFELNKIWSRREQRLLQRVKANCATETSILRRQLAFNPKYDEHQSVQTINRLKNQLKSAYKENREAFAQRQTRNPPGIHYISETMKMTKEMQRSKKKNEETNQLLKKKLEDVENLKFLDNSEKVLFMEGAQWLGSKIEKETANLIEEFRERVTDFEQKEEELRTEAKKKGSSVDTNAFLRKQDWFIENMENVLKNFRNRVDDLKKASENDMINAHNQAKKVCRPKSAIIDTF